jgi:hypothetical protein
MVVYFSLSLPRRKERFLSYIFTCSLCYLSDYWVIGVDDKNIDDSVEVIREYLGNIPGEIVTVHFDGMGTTWSQLVQVCDVCDLLHDDVRLHTLSQSHAMYLQTDWN